MRIAKEAIRGLVEEGKEAIEDSGALRDVAIIAAAQNVERYEISAYGTAKAWAEKLGNDEAVALLDETLEEEKTADLKLTEVKQTVLEEAGSIGEHEEEREEV